jgi:hypothetical protein
MEVPKLIQDSAEESLKQGKKSVYVYNYRENRTRRMKKRELLEKFGKSGVSSISI